MKRCVVIILFAILFLPKLEALNRDNYSGDYPCCYCYYHYFYRYHFPDPIFFSEFSNSIPIELIQLIPSKDTCAIGGCKNSLIYLGYTDPDFRKYRVHLKRHLEYYSQHRDCNCYLLESSQEAAYINDTAYALFEELIFTTALSNLLCNKSEQKKIINNFKWLDEDRLVTSFVVLQFRFSDYYHLCRDIEEYSIATYEENEAAEIKDRLEDILDTLYTKFFALYSSCYKKHSNLDIDQEIRFMKLLVNDLSGFETTTVPSKATPSMPKERQKVFSFSDS